MNPEEVSRFKIVEHRPPTLPGCCALTGKDTDTWFFQIEDGQAFHGMVYISRTAFEELASLVGYGPKTSRAELKEMVDGLDPLLNTTLDRLRSTASTLLPAQELIESVNALSAEVAGLAGRIVKAAERTSKQDSSIQSEGVPVTSTSDATV